MESYIRDIVQVSLGNTPEKMLETSLDVCIKLSGASGGSILGEEGPYLAFLFSDVSDLIGFRVPFDSIAGVSVTESKVVYTYAPADKRHFHGVDEQISHKTNYLLSIPIPSIHQSAAADKESRNAGVLQLLYDDNILPNIDVSGGPREFPVDDFKENELTDGKLRDIFWILPMIAFGMEVMTLRQTSYQAIHELKNKMISGLSWIGYLKQDLAQKNAGFLEDDALKEDFELAELSVREAADLAKTYLQLTKIYSSNFVPTNINDVLAETSASARALSSELGAPNLSVETDFDPKVPVRSLDGGQLKMAFFNLAKNAVEALVEHGVKNPKLFFSTSCEGDGLVVNIQDNGPGMPREIADNLFIPFKTKKEGGTGLGLTITKKILDIHGAGIECKTGDSGTTFVVRM